MTDKAQEVIPVPKTLDEELISAQEIAKSELERRKIVEETYFKVFPYGYNDLTLALGDAEMAVLSSQIHNRVKAETDWDNAGVAFNPFALDWQEEFSAGRFQTKLDSPGSEPTSYDGRYYPMSDKIELSKIPRNLLPGLRLWFHDIGYFSNSGKAGVLNHEHTHRRFYINPEEYSPRNWQAISSVAFGNPGIIEKLSTQLRFGKEVDALRRKSYWNTTIRFVDEALALASELYFDPGNQFGLGFDQNPRAALSESIISHPWERVYKMDKTKLPEGDLTTGATRLSNLVLVLDGLGYTPMWLSKNITNFLPENVMTEESFPKNFSVLCSNIETFINKQIIIQKEKLGLTNEELQEVDEGKLGFSEERNKMRALYVNELDYNNLFVSSVYEKLARISEAKAITRLSQIRKIMLEEAIHSVDEVLQSPESYFFTMLTEDQKVEALFLPENDEAVNLTENQRIALCLVFPAGTEDELMEFLIDKPNDYDEENPSEATSYPTSPLSRGYNNVQLVGLNPKSKETQKIYTANQDGTLLAEGFINAAPAGFRAQLKLFLKVYGESAFKNTYYDNMKAWLKKVKALVS
jgi:hypothetical protein